MSDATIQQRVTTCLVNTLALEPDEATPDSDLRTDLGVDSLSAVECVMALEDEFELSNLSVDEFGEARTVRDVAAYVERLSTA